eukprot:GEMP01019286.1.p1 GENE.GEMP01019286.1~~GEMP01019286.1.p1  ORF type:complete len:602 (+),score=167.07 GEMP01019286.1:133-1938(+)
MRASDGEPMSPRGAEGAFAERQVQFTIRDPSPPLVFRRRTEMLLITPLERSIGVEDNILGLWTCITRKEFMGAYVYFILTEERPGPLGPTMEQICKAELNIADVTIPATDIPVAFFDEKRSVKTTMQVDIDIASEHEGDDDVHSDDEEWVAPVRDVNNIFLTGPNNGRGLPAETTMVDFYEFDRMEFQGNLPPVEGLFAVLLGIPTKFPELQWVAQEMMNAKLPPGVEHVFIRPFDIRFPDRRPFGVYWTTDGSRPQRGHPYSITFRALTRAARFASWHSNSKKFVGDAAREALDKIRFRQCAFTVDPKDLTQAVNLMSQSKVDLRLAMELITYEVDALIKAFSKVQERMSRAPSRAHRHPFSTMVATESIAARAFLENKEKMNITTEKMEELWTQFVDPESDVLFWREVVRLRMFVTREHIAEEDRENATAESLMNVIDSDHKGEVTRYEFVERFPQWWDTYVKIPVTIVSKESPFVTDFAKLVDTRIWQFRENLSQACTHAVKNARRRVARERARFPLVGTDRRLAAETSNLVSGTVAPTVNSIHAPSVDRAELEEMWLQAREMSHWRCLNADFKRQQQSEHVIEVGPSFASMLSGHRS